MQEWQSPLQENARRTDGEMQAWDLRKECRKMKTEANEVMYKMAEFLLKKMQESGLISEEEREKISVLNIETFSPELAKVYL